MLRGSQTTRTFQLWLQPDGSTSYTYASDASRDLFGAEPPHNDGGGSCGDEDVIPRLLHREEVSDYMPSLIAASRTLYCSPCSRTTEVTASSA